MNKNLLGLVILCLVLQGCMSTVTRFWNHDGWEPPPKEKKAYSECYDEYKQIHPAPDYVKLGPGSKEVQDYMGAMIQYTKGCMKRKGF